MFNDEKLKISVALDPPGGTVQSPEWASSDESVFTIADIAVDGLSAFARSVDGAQGVATISFKDAGSTPLSASMDIAVMGREVEATGVVMTAGEPEPK